MYDALDELHDRGLVDIQQPSPEQLRVISAETAGRTSEHELQHHTALPRTALSEPESVERRTEQRGVRTVDGEPVDSVDFVRFILRLQSRALSSILFEPGGLGSPFEKPDRVCRERYSEVGHGRFFGKRVQHRVDLFVGLVPDDPASAIVFDDAVVR